MKNFKDCYGVLEMNQTELTQLDSRSSETRKKKLFSFLSSLKKVLKQNGKNSSKPTICLKG